MNSFLKLQHIINAVGKLNIEKKQSGSISDIMILQKSAVGNAVISIKVISRVSMITQIVSFLFFKSPPQVGISVYYITDRRKCLYYAVKALEKREIIQNPPSCSTSDSAGFHSIKPQINQTAAGNALHMCCFVI